MTRKPTKSPSPTKGNIPQLAGLNQELADAFSAAVFGLVEHNCSCSAAKFVRLLVKYRQDIFKGGDVVAPDNYTTED